MFYKQIGRTNIGLPDIELISDKPVRDAVLNAVAADNVRQKAHGEVGSARTSLDEIRASELARHAAILAEDPMQIIETDAVEAAEKRLRVAMARAAALDVIVDKSVAALVATVADRSAAWGKKSVAAASKALAELSTAITTAERAREKLYASVGVLGLLEGGGLAIRHKPHGYTFVIDDGMDTLARAIVLAKKDLGEYAAALGLVKGEKATDGRPSDSDAPTALTAPPASIFEAAPEIGDDMTITAELDRDDDDD